MSELRAATIEKEALDAARVGKPLPLKFKLPVLSDAKSRIFAALRGGESVESVAEVGAVWHVIIALTRIENASAVPKEQKRHPHSQDRDA